MDERFLTMMQAASTYFQGINKAEEKQQNDLYKNLHEITLNSSQFNDETQFTQAIQSINDLISAGGNTKEMMLNLNTWKGKIEDEKQAFTWTNDLKAKSLETNQALDKLLESKEFSSGDLKEIRDGMNSVIEGARGHVQDNILKGYMADQANIAALIGVTNKIKRYDGDDTTLILDPFTTDNTQPEDLTDWYGHDADLHQAMKYLIAGEGAAAEQQLDSFEYKIEQTKALTEEEKRIAKNNLQIISDGNWNHSKQEFAKLVKYDEDLRSTDYVDENGQLADNWKDMFSEFQTGNPDFRLSAEYAVHGNADKSQEFYAKGVKSETVRQFNIINQAYEGRLDNLNQHIYTVNRATKETDVMVLPYLKPLKADGKNLYSLSNVLDQKKIVTSNLGLMIQQMKIKGNEYGPNNELLWGQQGLNEAGSLEEKVAYIKYGIANSYDIPMQDVTAEHVVEFIGKDRLDLTGITKDDDWIFKDSNFQNSIDDDELIARMMGTYIETDNFLNTAYRHLQIFTEGPKDQGFYYHPDNQLFRP